MQRRAHGEFVDAGYGDVPAKTEKSRASRVFRAEFGISSASFADNSRHVHQSLDVIDGSWLPEKSCLRGKRRFVAGFAAVALDGVEKRSLLATDVGSCAAAN